MALSDAQIQKLTAFTMSAAHPTLRLTAATAPTPFLLRDVARAIDLGLTGETKADTALLRMMLDVAVVQLEATASAVKWSVPDVLAQWHAQEHVVVVTRPKPKTPPKNPPQDPSRQERERKTQPSAHGKRAHDAARTRARHVQKHATALETAFDKRDMGGITSALADLASALLQAPSRGCTPPIDPTFQHIDADSHDIEDDDYLNYSALSRRQLIDHTASALSHLEAANRELAHARAFAAKISSLAARLEPPSPTVSAYLARLTAQDHSYALTRLRPELAGLVAAVEEDDAEAVVRRWRGVVEVVMGDKDEERRVRELVVKMVPGAEQVLGKLVAEKWVG
ncbi:hypothetical protein Tdes44962_MAKER08138 [Teratosphaeria destructans]|uniref:Uncharacterized protein n=1 Tax=Teratosphaeria destructans TaxID=418781 RepID=A0A9W7SXB3_9PEZI|nr:hypothetical protein Tdes44962_MAKER08138 [Teratosphaeria destructans]